MKVICDKYIQKTINKQKGIEYQRKYKTFVSKQIILQFSGEVVCNKS